MARIVAAKHEYVKLFDMSKQNFNQYQHWYIDALDVFKIF